MEALLELRDEANYLGLKELEKLCVDELRHQPASPASSLRGLHLRALSNESDRSLHTLREQSEPSASASASSPSLVEVRAAQRKSDDSGFASADAGGAGAGFRKSGGSSESSDAGAAWPSPPGLKERIALREGSPKKNMFATMKARPTGAWI